MKPPVIFCIDDDAQVLRAITRDIKDRYRKEYKILSTDSAREALDMLTVLRNKGETVALFLTDQRMPQMEGVDFLKAAAEVYPDAKRVLLTAYSDTDAAIRAINDVRLDYYLTKPWNPPAERLYPVLDELLDEWHQVAKQSYTGIRLIGYQYSPKSHAIKAFLAGNLVPYRWLDVEGGDEGLDMLQMNNLTRAELPVIFFEDGSFIADPSIQDVAVRIGLNPQAAEKVYDVAIIGAGPAGLAAAVYGASEGLKTLLIERNAPGGQAGTSSRIENYLGFPAGLSGSELTRRATAQASRLGAEFLSPRGVKAVLEQDGYKIVVLDDDSRVTTRAVVITTGVDYRKLGQKGIEQFTGAGIYYGAAMPEAPAYQGKQIYIVGGGNSAGQAAVYLSKWAADVYIMIRKDSLSYTMSAYLIDQIAALPNIHLLTGVEIEEAQGSDKLEKLVIRNADANTLETKPADALFIFIGAKPVTEWTGIDLIKDDKGFIATGRDLKANDSFKKIWKLEREPYLLETCTPGIFAAGDVRSGAMARVASAVGEGSMSISFVHRYLAEV
jgi:thioredoxin reductase (NADPH)